MDNACERLGCNCTHTEKCVKGFIWLRYVDRKTVTVNGEKKTIEKWYDGVRFCPNCYPERAQIQDSSTSSEELQKRLSSLSNHNRKINQENQEASRTKTL